MNKKDIQKSETKKDYKQLLRRLHVEKDGQIFSGAKAFLIVWKYIPKYRILYSIFRQPVLYHIFSGIYEIVAFFLYITLFFSYFVFFLYGFKGFL